MDELDDADKAKNDAVKKEETPVEENASPPKASNKSLVNISGAGASEPNSETSFIAPEDEMTLANSSEADEEAKKRQPRKLIEDEKRASGRIAWPVWRAYFTALGGPFWCKTDWYGWVAADQVGMFFVAALATAMVVPVAEKGWLQ